MSGSEETLLTWVVRPRDERPLAALGIVGAAMVAFLLGVRLVDPAAGFVGAAIVIGATADFLFGERFRLTERGASRRVVLSLSEIAWGDVRRVERGPGTIHLSPLSEEGWRQRFRGVVLRPTAAVREECERIVAERTS